MVIGARAAVALPAPNALAANVSIIFVPPFAVVAFCVVSLMTSLPIDYINSWSSPTAARPEPTGSARSSSGPVSSRSSQRADPARCSRIELHGISPRLRGMAVTMRPDSTSGAGRATPFFQITRPWMSRFRFYVGLEIPTPPALTCIRELAVSL
jgi:hypothetical protein